MLPFIIVIIAVLLIGGLDLYYASKQIKEENTMLEKKGLNSTEMLEMGKQVEGMNDVQKAYFARMLIRSIKSRAELLKVQEYIDNQITPGKVI
jgi:H2-forming N5,N10-methylenetetrahydromethanopterin dehydrogenase-like enzyme